MGAAGVGQQNFDRWASKVTSSVNFSLDAGFGPEILHNKIDTLIAQTDLSL
jgi:hypothetical protein